ncbi:MAG: hypothetical protein U1G07_25140 [Verrucomicrobiota bacterium]
MAKVTLNPILEAIQGKVGDMVFKRFGDEEIVAKMPNRTGIVATPNQLAQQERFRLASLYGRSVLADEQSRALYEHVAARKGVPVFALTIGDFLNSPAIDEIDLSSYTGKPAEVIRIRASDDVEVKGVTVTIRDQNGLLIEEGVAAWATATASWTYTTTGTVTAGLGVAIEVSATDRPGHKTTKTHTRA